jgi:hypothetical protein
MREWLQQLRLRWRFRQTLPAEGTAALPTPTVQHEDGARDYAHAIAPLPQTDEQQAHNAAIEAEYQAEIDLRRGLMRRGLYKARFYNMAPPAHDLPGGGTTGDWLNDPDRVNWDLELTLDAGRRLNLTTDPGTVPQPLVTREEVAERQATTRVIERLDRVEAGRLAAVTARDLIGTRAQILAACYGNAAMADLVEAKARDVLGVEDLDAPVGDGADDAA